MARIRCFRVNGLVFKTLSELEKSGLIVSKEIDTRYSKRRVDGEYKLITCYYIKIDDEKDGEIFYEINKYEYKSLKTVRDSTNKRVIAGHLKGKILEKQQFNRQVEYNMAVKNAEINMGRCMTNIERYHLICTMFDVERMF